MPSPSSVAPFVVDVEPGDRLRDGPIDVFRPPALPASARQRRPLVVLVLGGPLPASDEPRPRDWPVYRGYGALVAAAGLVAVVVEHRLHDLDSFPLAAEDVAAGVQRARELPGVDHDRVALWFFSGGGLLAADHLGSAPPTWLRAVALTYPVLAPFGGVQVSRRFQPVAAVSDPTSPVRVLLTRVGRERPEIAAGVTAFVEAARSASRQLTVIDVPGGRHGFDHLDHDDASREAVRDAVRWVADALEDTTRR